MHGRVRKKEGPSAEERAASKAKALKYRTLSKKILLTRKSGRMDEANCFEMLDVVSKLLSINCDAYTFWNYRREMLLAHKETFLKSAQKELELTATCLQKQPKSYSTWFHRAWIIQKFFPQVAKEELILCDEFLAVDERNFHCWNYRRAMCQLAQQSSIQFARTKLDANFSNYSALHELATSLPSILDDSQAEELLELVAQAIFTEPDDQSHWWFNETLIRRIHHNHLLSHHVNALIQLQELEPDSKWPAIARFRLGCKLLSSSSCSDYHDDMNSLLTLRQHIAHDLDPKHAAMYIS
mmetsp:Transcript_13664/g.20376  ORF Transcript_13664/g.20376 Transcript_13664/m.20376 type:complete len:297 (+) Transcript_13664:26-916(+)